MGQILAAGSWEKISRTNSRSQYGSRDLPILGRGQRSTFREWSECPQPMQMVDNRREIRNISSTWWSQMGREKNLTQLCHPQVKRILNSQRGSWWRLPSTYLCVKFYCSRGLVALHLVNRCHFGILFSSSLGIPLSSPLRSISCFLNQSSSSLWRENSLILVEYILQELPGKVIFWELNLRKCFVSWK